MISGEFSIIRFHLLYQFYLALEHNFTNCFLAVFTDAGIDLQKPIVVTDYIGHTACMLALAAAVCGKYDVPIYLVSQTLV